MSEPSPSARPHAPRHPVRTLRTVLPRLVLVPMLALAPLLALPTGPALAQASGPTAAASSSASSAASSSASSRSAAVTSPSASTSASASSAPSSSTSTTSHAAPASPAPNEPETSGGVSLDLLDGGATSLKAGATLRLKVRLTNHGSSPLQAPTLELRARTDRVTDRQRLEQWEMQTTPDTYGVPATTIDGPTTIAPGDSADLTLAVAVDDLGFSSAPYLWGARRLSVTATSQDEPLASLRTFTVWRPEGSDAAVSDSVMLPIAAEDPGQVVADTQAFSDSATDGHLADVVDLATRDDVDWLLDPSLLDPPAVADKSSDSSSDDEKTGDADPPAPTHYTTPKPASDLADALRESAGDRTVVGLPYAQADLPALESAGTKQLTSALEKRQRAVWKDSGIDPAGQADVIPGPEASGKSLSAAVDNGADTLVVPSSSLRADPLGTVTPSSIGTFTSGDDTVPVLAPDPTLSEEFGDLRRGEDVEQVRQRVLAETAVIASEQSSSPRQLLIVPELAGDMDADAVTSTLDALGTVPWLKHAPTSDLLDAAAKDHLVTDTGTSGDSLYALGSLGPGDVAPSGPGEDGTWGHLPKVRSRDGIDEAVLTSLQSSLSSLDTVTEVTEDSTPFESTRELILSTTSSRLAGHGDVASTRAASLAESVAGMRGAIHVVPASGYNLVSDSAGVPITVTNGLDSPIRVQVEVSTDRPIVRVGEPTTVEVPARQKREVTVPIDAIANGTVTLTTSISSESGTELTSPVSVPLSVNPAWENWLTLVVVGAMGVLVVVGVLRARRTGSRRRAAATTDDVGEAPADDPAAEEDR